MLESPQSGTNGREIKAGDSVVELASRALSVLSMRSTQQEVELIPDLVVALHDAALDPQSDSFVPVLACLHAAQITDRQIADHYLPAVARKLGEEWCDDVKSFSEVTIGVSRLQRLLRDLGPEWRADTTDQLEMPAVLLLTSPGADHTFGAKVLVGQLRRRGLSVKLAVGLRPDQVKALLARAHFDAVMISASQSEAFVSLRALIDAIKSITGVVPPVVVGGSICMLNADVKARTGADYVTSDVDEAIHLCALDGPVRSHAQPLKKR